MAYADLVTLPRERYCGIIREGVMNQLTDKYNGLPINIGEEEAMMMWENGVQEVHLTQHELISVDLGRYWYKDDRITPSFRWKGSLAKRNYCGEDVTLICFQEVHQDNIFLTVVGEEWVIQHINDNKKFMSERPESIIAKEEHIEDYNSPCWWAQKDVEYRKEIFDKNGNRVTTVEDYDYEDFLIYDNWNNVKRNRKLPVLEKILGQKEEQLQRYKEKFSPASLELVKIIGYTDYVNEIIKMDGEEFWKAINRENGFKITFGGVEIGKDLAWAIWQTYRMPDLEAEIYQLKKDLGVY